MNIKAMSPYQIQKRLDSVLSKRVLRRSDSRLFKAWMESLTPNPQREKELMASVAKMTAEREKLGIRHISLQMDSNASDDEGAAPIPYGALPTPTPPLRKLSFA